MQKYRKGFTVLLAGLTILAFTPSLAKAHYIWIETEPQSKPGEVQEVHFYYGEYHEFLREEAGGRLEEIDGIKAWVIDPDGKKIEVALAKEKNHFKGAISPKKAGRYNITASNLEREVVDWSKHDIGIVRPTYYARTQFISFEKGRVSESEEEIKDFLELDIVPVTKFLDPLKETISPQVGEEVALRVFFKAKPLAEAKLSAYAFNGWLKELRADSGGITRFVPLWKGRYVIECIYLEKTPGEFKGKRYEAIRHRATFTIMVDEKK